MKTLILALSSLVFASTAFAGESGLSTIYQPLDSLGAGGIRIVSVTCHDWHAMSGVSCGLELISAANVPPTNKPALAKEDLNLASVCGLHFSSHDLGYPKAKPALKLDATQFKTTKRFSQPKEDILRASLECLRRCLPDILSKIPLTLDCNEENKEWMQAIVDEFNKHDRSKPFFTPEH
ncbi:hypothetical protein Rhal01_02098 [Rubritalea halochordaticola]|uniref:Uncharacterized protein n=1 Tax=Rubritalea halochordaticola TaxID=714537 RepID=A0ABP9V3L4_9BACT